MLSGMKLLRAALALLAVSALASAAYAEKTPVTMGAPLGAAPSSAPKPPACVKWSTQVVSTAAGHNHVVAIENGCERPAACVVSTDVAPDPIQATVQPRQRVELVTYRGSPASTFRAKVECTLQ